MKDLFLTFLGLLDGRGAITEASLLKDGTFSKVVIENQDGKFTIAIHKENDTDGNS